MPEVIDINSFEVLMISLGYIKVSKSVKEEQLINEAWSVLFGD